MIAIKAMTMMNTPEITASLFFFSRLKAPRHGPSILRTRSSAGDVGAADNGALAILEAVLI
jgi:hypothetical protein